MKDITGFLQKQKAERTGGPPSVVTRRERLRRLDAAIFARQNELLQALRQDLGKPAIEAYASEIAFVRSEIRFARARLARWARLRRVSTPPLLWPGRSRTNPRPHGQCLILAPWNYPFQLLFSPLTGALAAGNIVVVKPSEISPATAAVTERIIADAFDPGVVCCITGDADTSRELLEHPFDFIFFTGSTAVGSKVLESAARHLTPVALELGGKCPCIVNADADIGVAGRRIAWGKFLNAGQTCLAPDHILAHADIVQELTRALVRSIQTFYGSDPQQSPDYGRIIHHGHWQRLTDMLSDGEILHGGGGDAEARYLEPTLVHRIRPGTPLDREEIFGPILPVYSFRNEEGLRKKLQRLDSPLAMYSFGADSRRCRRQADWLKSGSLCLNDTVRQVANRALPFGGVGASGFGRYHGKASFEVFSFVRSELERGTAFDPRVVYPPYRISLAMFRRILRWMG